MAIKERMSGNEAVSIAIRQVNPDVMPAFPITPSTEIPQYVAQYVADGTIDTVQVLVESEHSAMSAAIGSQAAGARTVTATSSCGLALMWEMLYVSASNKLPITMAVVNRALSGPININADHSDSMGARDSGWIQIYSENNQEAYDNFIQAFRIGEHPEVQLPVMVCQDGFITSHAVENIELIEDEAVKGFVGAYEPTAYLLNDLSPMSMGPYDSPAFYMEHKRLQAQSMAAAKKVIRDVAAEFEKMTGRPYGFFETYRLEDAEIAMVIINSAAGTAKDAVDNLREKGIKAGLLKIRVFRPFPAEELAGALEHLKQIAVMDRVDGFSNEGGPLFAEVRSALYEAEKRPAIYSCVYGLGGKDFRVTDAEALLADMAAGKAPQKGGLNYSYIGIRQGEGSANG